MNPLQVPWGKKPTPIEEEVIPSFIGVRNEASRAAEGEKDFIVVSLEGVRGAPNGSYKVSWSEGTSLKQYLSQLKLVMVATRAAIRDASYPDSGRLRLRYVPKKDSRIVLCNPSVSSALQYQQSSVNAESVARKMGGGSRFVEVPLRKK